MGKLISWAIERRQSRYVQALIDAGADANVMTSQVLTYYRLADKLGLENVCQWLLDADVDPALSRTQPPAFRYATRAAGYETNAGGWVRDKILLRNPDVGSLSTPMKNYHF